MKTYTLLCLSVLFIAACHTVHTPLPDAKTLTRPAQQTLQNQKKKLQAQRPQTELADVLGGLVQSDQWTVYKDLEQEEFTGHVFYENGQYTFKSDYALSDRKAHTVTASGNVQLKQHLPQNPVYEATANWGRYNYKTGEGTLKSSSKNPVFVQMTDENQTVTARAKRIDFNTQTQIFTLQGNVLVTRVTPQGTQTMQADKIILKQQEDYVYLTGHAQLSDGQQTLQADTVLYDGAHNQARAFGARPLLTGATEQGTFAIIADTVASDAQGNHVTLDGRVQGWLVSPALNNNELNTKF